ncbi:uncharacterized protein BX664DRAFT_386424 [Halteromyces radiatus]|uniref:uncharacterized protein n=1 Tax=Halteromyces radiatus TaxID=101107 RepID=UPI00221F05AE|nr:uncharacterized protein BX664DRAFT_386424 [Halteromyces radiatus]KAI8090032.1 hypothetical protein BX664DRAFT_386424 [Halteromyces radiatus]
MIYCKKAQVFSIRWKEQQYKPTFTDVIDCSQSPSIDPTKVMMGKRIHVFIYLKTSNDIHYISLTKHHELIILIFFVLYLKYCHTVDDKSSLQTNNDLTLNPGYPDASIICNHPSSSHCRLPSFSSLLSWTPETSSSIDHCSPSTFCQTQQQPLPSISSTIYNTSMDTRRTKKTKLLSRKSSVTFKPYQVDDLTSVKPRWQETERKNLLKAIVKEKQLDDMTSFSWDRISLAVGRAKKACKDQWRREVLPALLDKLK